MEGYLCPEAKLQMPSSTQFQAILEPQKAIQCCGNLGLLLFTQFIKSNIMSD